MIKVLFLSWHFATPEIFLESILKMTPGRKGIWKNVQAVLDPEEADYYIIMDGWNGPLPNKEEKAIYFGQHPRTPGSPIHKMFHGQQALLKFPLQHFLNPGEWWIEYDYDYLTQTCLPYGKTKDLACVATYQTHNQMYTQRQIFIRELVNKYPSLKLDIYGRPMEKYESDEALRPFFKGVLGNNTYDAVKGEHLVGKTVIKDYKYTLEFDVGPCKNYFSERFYDAVLLWCTPIYFGCTNMWDFFPKKGYYLFDQHDLEDVYKIRIIMERQPFWHDLGKIRNLLLNKYQTWAYVHHVVNNIENYQNEPTLTFRRWINEK